MSLSERRGVRDRKPDNPVVGMLCDRYAEWYMDFRETGEATRSELAAVFFEKAADAAREFVEMEECSRPAPWNDYTRDPRSKHLMDKHYDERRAWAKAIDLLWTFSEDDAVDADALQEALLRMSFRRHASGHRRDRNEEHIFVKAAGIVREKAGIERMTDARSKDVRGDYR